MLVQNILNDEDLQDLPISTMRSVVIHATNAFQAASDEEDNIPEGELNKYIL